MPGRAPSGSVLRIDTHKLTHVAAIVDGLGRMQGTFAFAATDAGTIALLPGPPLTVHPGLPESKEPAAGYQLARAPCRSRASPCSRSTDPTGPIDAARARVTPLTPRRPPGPSWQAKPQPSRRTVKDRRIPTCVGDCAERRRERHHHRESPDQGDPGRRRP